MSDTLEQVFANLPPRKLPSLEEVTKGKRDRTADVIRRTISTWPSGAYSRLHMMLCMSHYMDQDGMDAVNALFDKRMIAGVLDALNRGDYTGDPLDYENLDT